MTKLFAVTAMLAVLVLRPTSTVAQIYFPRPPYSYPHPPRSRPGPDSDSSPVEFGGYITVGAAKVANGGGKVPVGAVGLYGNWNRTGLCPGLDLRFQGNGEYLHGVLVGPRLAYKPAGSLHALHPYVEALFGPNQYPRNPTSSNFYPGSYRGVTSAAAFGLDGDISPHFRFRLIEFSRETFTGLARANPYTIVSGIVLHLP